MYIYIIVYVCTTYYIYIYTHIISICYLPSPQETLVTHLRSLGDLLHEGTGLSVRVPEHRVGEPGPPKAGRKKPRK